MTFASLSGASILTASIVIPLVGAWSGDVVLATDADLSTPASLVLGDLTMAGAVMRHGVAFGRHYVRLVGGAGGWRNSVAPRHYQHSFGVTKSMVIGDAAREVGETANVPDDSPLGNDYVRAAPGGIPLRASDVLRTFAPAWYVDARGVTQCASWPSSSIASPFQVLEHDPGVGRLAIATEKYSDWMPGRTFAPQFSDGNLRNVATRFHLDEEGVFRLDVLTVSA